MASKRQFIVIIRKTVGVVLSSGLRIAPGGVQQLLCRRGHTLAHFRHADGICRFHAGLDLRVPDIVGDGDITYAKKAAAIKTIMDDIYQSQMSDDAKTKLISKVRRYANVLIEMLEAW